MEITDTIIFILGGIVIAEALVAGICAAIVGIKGYNIVRLSQENKIKS